MKTALKLAHFNSIPADSEIHVKGRNLRRILVAIDVGVSELLLAQNLNCDGVIAHHPAGGKAQLEGYKVFLRHIEQMKAAGVPAKIAEEAVKSKYRVLDFQHGVGTLSYIHISEADLTKLASDGFANLVVLGHIASDWLGINRLLRELEKNDIEPVTTTDLYTPGRTSVRQ